MEKVFGGGVEMRKVNWFACALVAPAAALAATFGPRANPDDQFRYFWLINEAFYPEMVASGFNTFIQNYWGRYSLTRGTYKDTAIAEKHKLMDRILADNCDYIEQLPIANSKDFMAKYPRIKKDGSTHRNLDVAYPEAWREVMKATDLIISSISNHPACIGIEPSSEVRDGTRPTSREYFAERYRAATGQSVPAEVGDAKVAPHYLQLKDFPVSRVIDEDYRLLKFYRWFWKTGDGWNDYQTAAKKSFEKQFNRPALAMYDPIVRVPPLWGSGGEMTHGNQWTYPTPEPYNIYYVISEQQAMARGTPGQKVVSMIQGISYRSRLAPKEVAVANPPAWLADRPNVVYMTTPPDILREGIWAMFAHQLDGIGAFACRSLFDAAKLGHSKTAAGYQFTNPHSIVAISNVFHEVGIPLGPLFRAVPERKPEVAMLESYASTFFAGRGSWGWDGWIYQCGIMATCANLQPYVLYEEEIAQDGIPATVKVIIAPHCDVLTKTTFDALKKFQSKGGLIVGDRYLVPGILPDLPLEGFRRTWKDGLGDNAALHASAQKLKRSLAPFYRPPADSENEHIVTAVRSSGSADYLFAINDKREFGDYVGLWGMVMEKGAPNEGVVTIRRKAGAVYDLVAHKLVPHKILENGDTAIDVKYSTNDGKVFLVADRPLKKLKAVFKNGRVQVASPDKDVMIPVGIFAEGEKPYYGVVKNGVFSCPARTAKVKVVNLADGREYNPVKWWKFW
ncbi:MAG: hypothetical protein J6R18_05300 [Kiritimatiellae bacterium]|nr:hypothetical protein [Kiritimatiellia bacterium]